TTRRSDRAGPPFNDYDLGGRITFWCLPTCTGGGGRDLRFAKRRAILCLLRCLLLGAHRMDHANRLNGKSVASCDAAHAAAATSCGIAFMAKASAPGRGKTRL